jgi:hypothetical protein
MTPQDNAKKIKPGHVYMLLEKLIKKGTLSELQAKLSKEDHTCALQAMSYCQDSIERQLAKLKDASGKDVDKASSG